MKKIIIGIIFIISLIVTLLLTNVQISTFDRKFFQDKFEEYNISEVTKMEENTLMEVTDEMLKYLKGDRKDLIIEAKIDGRQELVFGEREILHMVDVRNLFKKGFMIRNISLILVIVTLFLIVRFYIKDLYKILIIASIVPTLILFIFGILLSINFNKYFDIFHEILFTNDLWLLNPDTDILIQMLPLDFFNSIAIKTLIYLILQLIIILFLGIILRKKYKIE
ncbi:TIGR01906 family membrane protein [Clostridium sp. D2Q-14]|uniref:TIGR01906 family membrane protein n=1 Tax=Anaeromonas gelatinilytica TaxID=2683194 RepID=UPI00193B6DA8|nr:TIGR01906 family membrane protein [Anaeromonas gelatinilytica]MBS4535444.1 TIGR01906 family membrane protein [Anaeromonas gelatinilytica]